MDLYHRTTHEAAEEIRTSRRMLSKETDGSVYFSTRRHGQAGAYGDAIVHVRVPCEIAQLDDEFPSGEQHYRIQAANLRPSHFHHKREEATDEHDMGH